MEAEFRDGGSYNARVEPPVKFDESAANSTPYLNIPLMVTEGPMAGRTLDAKLYLVDGAKDMVAKQLRVLGFEPTIDDWNEVEKKISGAECNFIVEIKEFKGKLQSPRINGIRPKRTGEADGGIAMLAARLFGNENTKPLALKTDDDEPSF